ncbi:MAG: heparan-alpha-glucosaminide N-acetyltransferase domain-containing protein [Sandaracinaceae bacterium]
MTEKRSRGRLYFVDVVRLIASFQMINGHTLDLLMVDSVRQGVIYDRYMWMRGLVSVAFLSVAGIAFHLATLARFEAHKRAPTEVKRRFRRALILIALGYLLRFPGAAFGDDPVAAAAAWDSFFQVGVLQAIGVALFALELAVVLAKKPVQVVWFAGIAAAGMLFGAPYLEDVPIDGAWQPFTAYLTHASGSLFPLFPWSGFMLAGAVVGWIAMPEGGSTRSRVAVPRLAAITLGLVALYFVLDALGPFGSAHAHLATPPAFSVERLAAVLGIVTVLGVVCAPIERFPRLLSIISAETLFVYVFHLWVLYAGVLGIEARFSHSVSLPISFLASAVMMVITISATVAWHHRDRWTDAARTWIKENWPLPSRAR